MQQPPNGPRPAFARPLPPNISSFSSSGSSPPLSSSPTSPSGSPLQSRPLPSLVRRQQSFSSSSPAPSSDAPPQSPSAAPSPLSGSSSGLRPSLHGSGGEAPTRLSTLPRVPSGDLPPTPSPSSPLATSTQQPPNSNTAAPSAFSPRREGGLGGKASPRRPPIASPRGPLPPLPPTSASPSPLVAESQRSTVTGLASSSSASAAAVSSASPASPRDPSDGSAIPTAASMEPETTTASAAKQQQDQTQDMAPQEWPSTGSQRHQPSVGPSLVTPFVPPPVGLSSSSSSSAPPSGSSVPPAPSSGDGVSSTSRPPATRDDELLKVLTTGEGRVMMVLLNSLEFSDMDKISRAAVEYFVAAEPQDANHPLLLGILKALLLHEISDTEDPTTLFRSNTNGSKMLSACLRICGMNYLKDTIGPIIARVSRDTPAVEIDPERANSPEEAQANVANLHALCESFLTTILSSLDSCPEFLRRIFAYLQEAAVARFPDNKQITANYSIVGGFIFLRFFCSAIFSPVGFGVTAEQPRPEAMRAFLLVSKVLQMIANGLSFSDKTSEEYMRDMNPFLEKHQADVIAFFRAVATVPEQGPALENAFPAGGASLSLSSEGSAAGDALHSALHKYSAALASTLSKEEKDHMSGVLLAEFLAAFPAPAPAPAAGGKAPPTPERIHDQPAPAHKKKVGLGFSAAGKRATTIMSTLRGHDKDKNREKDKEREREREREEKRDGQSEEKREQQEDQHTPPVTPTLLSARRKEEGGTLHDLKSLLVQLRAIKTEVEKEIAGVEQQILDIITGQTPAESVTLSPSTLALLAAASRPAADGAAMSEAQKKEKKKAEREREQREKEEKERLKREQKEKEKEEKKEERRSRRLSIDALSASKLKRRTVNPDDLKDFAKFSESFGNKFGAGRSSGSSSRRGSRSGSGSGSEIIRPITMEDSPDISSRASAADSPLKSVSAPSLEDSNEKRSQPNYRASVAVSSLSHLNPGLEKRSFSPLDTGGEEPFALQDIVEKASIPASGLIKDRKVKLRAHKNCFVGSEFVDWLVVNRRAKMRSEALDLAQQMFLQKLIVPVNANDTQFEDKKTLYRFFGGEGGFSPVSSPISTPQNPFPDEGDDELDKLYPHMTTEIEIKNRKDCENKTHKNCFVAAQAIEWLLKNRHQPMTYDQAMQYAEKLRQRGYIKWVGRKTKKLTISGPMSSVQATAASLASGPPFEDDDSYYVFEKKNKNRSSTRAK